MALSSTHNRHVYGGRAHSGFDAHSLRTAIERGTYTALLSAVGFVIVNLLKVAERRDQRS